MQSYESKRMPRAFFWRRIQSLMGLFLIIFLIEHFLTNSQAALFFGDFGNGFIQTVNSIKELPYLTVIEITFIALPFAIHIIWGLKYLFTADENSYYNSEKDPYLPHFPRNRAYTWQRITSWILFIGIILHVIDMRFINYPSVIREESQIHYKMPVTEDPELYKFSKKLNAKLVKDPNSEELISISPNFGTAELLLIRETFKSPLMVLLYTIFVLASTYHACNGLWSFCIKWGITLTARSQSKMLYFSYFLMFIIGFLGLMAIWGSSSLINLKG